MDTNIALSRELRIARRIPAPPDAVFAAWTQPEQIKAWFGPKGMTTPVAEVDLRPGGLHRTVMRDAEGKDYDNPLLIDAVEAPRRLVVRVPDGTSCPVPGTIGTMTFAPDPAGTLFEARWEHRTAEQRAQHEALGFARGWGETLDKLCAHVTRPAQPMGPPPSIEHGWLHRLLGEWRYETRCAMGNGDATGRESVRSLGGYWVVGEAEGTMPGGLPARWVMTAGFDPALGRFRGTWVGSFIPHMFVYDGALSEDGRSLALESEGPSCMGEGMARYRDTVAFADDDTRLLRSEIQGADGAWTPIMSATFKRIG